jgi:GMP synthase (glutamine-hydrolysing)
MNLRFTAFAESDVNMPWGQEDYLTGRLLPRAANPRTMILVLENEVDPETRYFVPEIVRHLRSAEADIEIDVYDYTDEGGQPSLRGVEGVVIGGSTAGVYEADTYPWMDEQREFVHDLIDRRIPTLGVCFGHQLVNEALGGHVEHHGLQAELVRADLRDDPLFKGVSPIIPAVHGDVVTERGNGLSPIASTDSYETFATRHRDAPLWTVQYHPEFTDRLKARIATDFGWTENRRSFGDVTASRTLSNFVRLAKEASAQ